MLMETLIKFTAGAKLFTYLNSGWGVVVHIYKFFAASPASGIVN